MKNEEEDVADAARVIAGDVAAFEGIVRRWQRRLISLAWRFSRDRSTAEDMAQEVFVKVFRSLARFRGDSAFSTWLIAIALNTYRSRISSEGQPLLSLDPARAFGTEPGVLQGLQQREREEALRRAVLALPQRYREAVVMYYFEERDLAETARILGVPEGTVKARLHRGRELLRSRCAQFEPVAAEAVKEDR